MTIAEFRDYCLSLPGTRLDFPFDATTMTVKVGPPGRDRMFALADVEAVPSKANLKCEPALARDLRAAYPSDVAPGFHMNKEHWNTVALDGGLSDDQIRGMVDLSYDLVAAGLPKSVRPSRRTS